MPFPVTAKLMARNYVEDIGGSVDRSDMDDGNAKQGRARTFDQRVITLRYLMTADEYSAFREFHKTELFNGAFRWLWKDPETGLEKSARIVKGDYKMRPHKRFRACVFVDFQLEVFN